MFWCPDDDEIMLAVKVEASAASHQLRLITPETLRPPIGVRENFVEENICRRRRTTHHS